MALSSSPYKTTEVVRNNLLQKLESVLQILIFGAPSTAPSSQSSGPPLLMSENKIFILNEPSGQCTNLLSLKDWVFLVPCCRGGTFKLDASFTWIHNFDGRAAKSGKLLFGLPADGQGHGPKASVSLVVRLLPFPL